MSSLPNNLENIKSKPLHPDIGIEISGIDLTQTISGSVFNIILDNFNQHAVILFRNQPLNDEQQIAFSRLFGDLEPTSIMTAATNQYVYQISNIDVYGKVLKKESPKRALLEVNTDWHIDSSFKSPPALASILSARQIPNFESSDTEFCSLVSAYESLSTEEKQFLSGLICIHDYNYSLDKKNNTGVPQHEKHALKPCEQPLIHKHPVNGKPCLYISNHIKSIKGIPENESRKIIEDLIDKCTQAEHIYKHEWQQDDLICWDNRSVMHRSTGVPKKEVRRAHRTTIQCKTPLINYV